MNVRNLELMEQQRANEREAIDLGAERYRRALEQGEDKMPPGMELIRRSIVPLAARVREWVDTAYAGQPGRHVGIAKFAAQFEPEALAFMTARYLMRAAGYPRPLSVQAVALELAKVAEDTLNWDAIKENDPALYKKLQRKLTKANHEGYRHVIMRRAQNEARIEVIKWEQAERLRFGISLVHMAVEETGFAEITLPPGAKRDSPQVIIPTTKVADWLEAAHRSMEVTSPMYPPMIVRPIPRSAPTGGGYLTSGLATTLIKTRNKGYLEELEHIDMPLVYQAVNALQDTRWGINKGVLRVARAVWDEGGRIGGLPSRDPLPLPHRDFPEDLPGTDERVRIWKRKASAIYEKNIRSTSKRISTEEKLRMAERFAENESLHFVYTLDWRGRIYPLATHLSPQGDDLSKSLLQFAEGHPLGETGAYWLAVHGANSYGVDKVPFDERVQWVLDHQDQILESAMNPLDGSRWWADGGSAWQFLAFCFEWAGCGLQGDSYVSHLPVSWDGACNGLQNYSAMLRDEVGGKSVGLVPGERPADIYTEVKKASQALIDALAENGTPEQKALAKKWVGGKLERRHTKTNTMTVPYSVSRYGMSDQLMEEFKKIEEELEEELSRVTGERAAAVRKRLDEVKALTLSDAAFVAGCNYQAIGEVVVAARRAMDWLKEVSKVVASDGLPVAWVTPSGLPVLQNYKEHIGKEADFQVGGKRYRMILTREGTRLNGRKQQAGIAPNFIHSLDASHLMKTIDRCLRAGIKDFAMVHDSYGCHAAHAEELSYQLRAAFVEQYEGDVLGDFAKQLAENLPPELAEKLPPRPPMGSLDLSKVIESDYFFA